MTLPATHWTHPIHHRFPAITWAVLAAEIDREISARQGTYPDRVERGRMTQAEMDWQLQMARAWREDVDRFERSYQPLASGRPAVPPAQIPASHDVTWRQRRAALLRELEQRQRFYPEWIAKGRMTEASAASRIDCLECLLALYELGYDWTPANPAEREAEIRTILAEIAARAVAPQQELFA